MSSEVNRLIGRAVQRRIECQSENPGSTPPLLIGFANVRDDIRKNRDAIRKKSQTISIETVCCQLSVDAH